MQKWDDSKMAVSHLLELSYVGFIGVVSGLDV